MTVQCTWPECDMEFANSAVLADHMRTHTNVKLPCKYSTEGCEHTAHGKANLRKHERVCPKASGDAKVTLYECPECPYKALRRDNLTRHMRKEHADSPLPLRANTVTKAEADLQLEAAAAEKKAEPRRPRRPRRQQELQQHQAEDQPEILQPQAVPAQADLQLDLPPRQAMPAPADLQLDHQLQQPLFPAPVAGPWELLGQYPLPAFDPIADLDFLLPVHPQYYEPAEDEDNLGAGYNFDLQLADFNGNQAEFQPQTMPGSAFDQAFLNLQLDLDIEGPAFAPVPLLAPAAPAAPAPQDSDQAGLLRQPQIEAEANADYQEIWDQWMTSDLTLGDDNVEESLVNNVARFTYGP